jgi:hypothetical protein
MSAKQTLQNWLSKGENGRVLDVLPKLAQTWGDKYFINEVIQQAGRYNGLIKEKNKGLIDEKHHTLQLNNIRIALLDLINRLPDALELPESMEQHDAQTTDGSQRETVAVPESDMSENTSRAGKHIPWIVGLLLLLTALFFLVFFVPCPTKPVENVLRLLMALGAAGIATQLPGLFHLEFSGIKAGSALGIFALIYLVNPAGAMKDSNGCQDFSNVIVGVHGTEGAHQKILRDQGHVVIGFSQKTEKANINGDGEAVFLNVPTTWLQEPVKIYLEHPQPYQVLRPDSLYRIPVDGKVYVAVRLQNADRLFGTITDSGSRAFLDSVRVSVRNIAAYTDKNGWFELRIPPDVQSKFQRVTMSRPGYETVVFDSIPFHTQQEFSYSLIKVKKK